MNETDRQEGGPGGHGGWFHDMGTGCRQGAQLKMQARTRPRPWVRPGAHRTTETSPESLQPQPAGLG